MKTDMQHIWQAIHLQNNLLWIGECKCKDSTRMKKNWAKFQKPLHDMVQIIFAKCHSILFELPIIAWKSNLGINIQCLSMPFIFLKTHILKFPRQHAQYKCINSVADIEAAHFPVEYLNSVYTWCDIV